MVEFFFVVESVRGYYITNKANLIKLKKNAVCNIYIYKYVFILSIYGKKCTGGGKAK